MDKGKVSFLSLLSAFKVNQHFRFVYFIFYSYHLTLSDQVPKHFFGINYKFKNDNNVICIKFMESENPIKIDYQPMCSFNLIYSMHSISQVIQRSSYKVHSRHGQMWQNLTLCKPNKLQCRWLRYEVPVKKHYGSLVFIRTALQTKNIVYYCVCKTKINDGT